MGLLINTKKTKELVFCNQRDDPDPPSIMITNAAIKRVEDDKYLGTAISHKLNFNATTRNIIDKANKRLFIIKQLVYMNAKTSTIAYTCVYYIPCKCSAVSSMHHHIWTTHV